MEIQNHGQNLVVLCTYQNVNDRSCKVKIGQMMT